MVRCGVRRANAIRFVAIGVQRMPSAIVHALAQIKHAAAEVDSGLALVGSGPRAGLVELQGTDRLQATERL